jgi:hypothetical protein
MQNRKVLGTIICLSKCHSLREAEARESGPLCILALCASYRPFLNCERTLLMGKDNIEDRFKSGVRSYGNFRHPVRAAAREMPLTD